MQGNVRKVKEKWANFGKGEISENPSITLMSCHGA